MENLIKKLTQPSESYMNTPKVVFEKLSVSGGPSHLSRAKVNGGWLVWSFTEGMSNAGGTCFVPDPNHDWNPETPAQLKAAEKAK